MKMKKEHVYLIAILLAGIVARIIKFDDPAIVMDTVSFTRLAKNLIEFGNYVFGENYNMGVFFPPGYPFFVGVVDLMFSELIFSAKLVSFLASCGSIIIAYLIGKELYNSEGGLFAALVFACYPVLLIISVDVYADALFFCLLLISIYTFMVTLKNNSLYLFILFGMSLSILFLTRPEGVFLLALPMLQVLGVFDGRIRFNKKYMMRVSVTFILFVLIISPYMLFLKDYTGKFTLSGKSNVSILLGEASGDREYHDAVNAPDNLYDRLAFQLNEDKTELMGWGKGINFSLKDYLFKDPISLLSRYLKNILREINTLNKLLIPILLPLFFAFFNRDLFKKRIRLIFIMLPMMFFFMYPLFIIIEKQTLLIVIFLVLFASGGFANSSSVLSDILDYYGIKKNKPLLLIEKHIKLVIVLILLMSSLSYLKYSGFENTQSPVEHIAAGEYLKKNVVTKYEQINVMTRKPFVNFYSDARFTMIPYASVEDVLSFARLYKVDYIVVDERFLSNWDAYDELLKLQNYSEDVELVYEDSSIKLIKLFKINSPKGPDNS